MISLTFCTTTKPLALLTKSHQPVVAGDVRQCYNEQIVASITASTISILQAGIITKTCFKFSDAIFTALILCMVQWLKSDLSVGPIRHRLECNAMYFIQNPNWLTNLGVVFLLSLAKSSRKVETKPTLWILTTTRFRARTQPQTYVSRRRQILHSRWRGQKLDPQHQNGHHWARNFSTVQFKADPMIRAKFQCI